MNRMDNTITEMKTTLEGINSRITEAEERISDLEDRMVKFTAAEQNKEKRMKRNEDSLRDLWDKIKCNNKKLREFSTTRPALQQMLKELL